MPAQQTFGRYEVVSEIGKGAMGVVYKARDPMLDRMVAVKTILMAGGDKEDEQRFYQEAKAAGGLNHPNIITIFDIGKAENVAYMAMELLDGVELRQQMSGGKSVTVEQAIDVGIGVAEGLAYAHAYGVVHRDVKPSNIMILRDKRIKIMDFGIARMRESDIRTQTGMVLGSPRYMSPEQALGKRVDTRSDIFSLGVIIYEMIAGRPPFTGSDVNAIIYQTVNVQPPPPSTFNAKAPEMIDFIIAKALAKSPDERYATAQELAADLSDCRQRVSMGTGAAATARTGLGLPQADLARVDIDVASDSMETLANTPVADEDAAPPTLGLSRAFDSLDATLKLAKKTDTVEEVEEYISTQKRLAFQNIVPPPDSAAQTGLGAIERLSVTTTKIGMSASEKLGITLLTIAVLIIAAIIAFV